MLIARTSSSLVEGLVSRQGQPANLQSRCPKLRPSSDAFSVQGSARSIAPFRLDHMLLELSKLGTHGDTDTQVTGVSRANHTLLPTTYRRDATRADGGTRRLPTGA